MSVLAMPAERPACGEAEWRARVDLAAAYRLVARFGMTDVIYTHISARVPAERPGAPEAFLINPYGLWFHEVTASSLVKVDIDGAILEDPTGLGINPAGFTIHSAIHAARSDVACVLHTHTPAGVAVSCQEDGLLPLNQWALQFHDRIAYHDYEGIALDLDERARLTRDLGDRPVMILRNHGLLVCGRSVGEAFKLIHNLERSCEAQLRAQSSGALLRLPPPEVRAHAASQYWASYDRKEAAGADIEWDAFLRLLDSEDQGYRA